MADQEDQEHGLARGLAARLSGEVGEEWGKRQAIEEVLKDYLLRKTTKSELSDQIASRGIAPGEFNALVRGLIAEASASTKQEIETIDYSKAQNRESLKLKGAIPEGQLQEIKKTVEDSGYIAKPYQQYSFFRRTSEDLSAAVSTRPQLISLFSASYNVLCSKTQKILSVKDLQNKLKKGSFEYKLNEHVPVDIAKCTYECLKHYVKHVIEQSLNSEQQLDKEVLTQLMFGNVRGIYLLYDSYPAGK